MKTQLVAIATMFAATLATPGSAQSLAGPYLAANQADLRNDYAAAADYYGQTLQMRPGNSALVNNAMVVNIISGRLSRAQALADRLQQLSPSNQLMVISRMAEALRSEDYALAGEFTVDAEEYRLNPLFSTLVQGWALVGEGKFAEGRAVFAGMTGNDAMEAYGQMNMALALAFAGDFASAAEILDGDEDGPLHLNRLAMLTHFVSLSQAERMDEAVSGLRDALGGTGGADRELAAMLETVEAGEALPFDQIRSAAHGAAQVYGVLAGALIREDNLRLGLVYGRLSLYINPDNDELLALIGDVLASQSRFNLAVSAYEEIPPSSPWYVSSEIGRAEALADAGREDEAVLVLSNLARSYPDLVSVHTALGDLLRQEEEFERAEISYTRAVSLLDAPAAPDWRLYYVRAITFERTDRWDDAEADFRKALELNPEQPHVLNYLGYSLVELRRNLQEAEDMIRRAVDQRPNDGFITDSLGWVLYRLGRYDEAVEPMERAVELEPLDPIINDHLGDVYWQVGRAREAEFQWRRALSNDPEKEEADRIRRKLEVGLDVVYIEEEGETEEAANTVQGD